MSLVSFIVLSVLTLITAEFGHRVIHFGLTGEGGLNDPIILVL